MSFIQDWNAEEILAVTYSQEDIEKAQAIIDEFLKGLDVAKAGKILACAEILILERGIIS